MQDQREQRLRHQGRLQTRSQRQAGSGRSFRKRNTPSTAQTPETSGQSRRQKGRRARSAINRARAEARRLGRRTRANLLKPRTRSPSPEYQLIDPMAVPFFSPLSPNASPQSRRVHAARRAEAAESVREINENRRRAMRTRPETQASTSRAQSSPNDAWRVARPNMTFEIAGLSPALRRELGFDDTQFFPGQADNCDFIQPDPHNPSDLMAPSELDYIRENF